MTDGFTKLYGTRLLSSTLWLESKEARLLFIGMLAAADANGIVDVPSVRVLARIVNLSVEDTEAGLAVLEAPDPDSRTPDEDGRRVVREGNVWRVVNHRKYREVQTKAQAQAAVRSKRRRAKLRGVTKCDGRDASRASRRVRTEAEAEAEAEAEGRGEKRALCAPPPANDQSAVRAHPARLLPVLLEELASEAFERNLRPTPNAPPSQLQAAAGRIQELVQAGTFPGPREAARALVRAALDLVRDHKRPLGLALLDATVEPPAAPFRDHVLPWGSV